jgi:hypothetical protein
VLHRFRGLLGLDELLEGGEVGDLEDHPRTIIGQRLKQSGMRWTVAGADAIIALRCREASGQWETICMRPRTQTGAA